MKIRKELKWLIYVTLGLLYLTGLGYFVLDTWFKEADWSEVGRFWQLRGHSVVGLAFLILFGYVYAKHVEPSLHFRRRLLSGFFFLIPLLVLFVSVPLLFYISNETWRSYAVVLHTYLGLVLIVPFLLHAILKPR